MWIVVLGATALVVGLAIVKGRTHSDGSSPLRGKVPPAVTLQLLDGDKNVALVDKKGRVVLLDFWATWCGPCRESMPRVQRVWKDFASRGVDLFAVNTDANLGQNRDPAIREFLMHNGLTLPVALDDSMGTAEAAFGVHSLPTLVVLDRVGKIAFSHVGSNVDEFALRRTIDAALAQEATAKVVQ